MVGARSAAMAFNRLVDAEIDASNPRTKMRHIPAGLLSRAFRLGLYLVVASAVFLFAAWELNPLCFRLAPLALAVVFAYSFTKRFTHLFASGARLRAGHRAGGGMDRRARVRSIPRILLLTAAVTFWTAGFDIIYSCQDYEFDRDRELFSVPRLVGFRPRSGSPRRCMSLMIVCLLAWSVSCSLGLAELAGSPPSGAADLRARPRESRRSSRVNAAFFTMNGWVSVLFFVFWAADIFLLSRRSLLECRSRFEDRRLKPIREKVEAGERLSYDDGLALYRSTDDLLALGYMANIVRERMHGDVTYFNVNRHINPDRRLRGQLPALRVRQAEASDPNSYTMSLEQVWERAGKGWSEAITEFHIVGGLHPELNLDWFCQMLRGLKERFPQIHLKAFTMVEIGYFARREKISVREVLERLREAGMDSLPGGGAEIFQRARAAHHLRSQTDRRRVAGNRAHGARARAAFQLHHALRPHRKRRRPRRSSGQAARSAGRDPRLRDLHSAGVSSG